MFNTHMKLHHSQTRRSLIPFPMSFNTHMKLHHSQTCRTITKRTIWFNTHMKLHHSQTDKKLFNSVNMFNTHMKLHHSQTPNSGKNHIIICGNPYGYSNYNTLHKSESMRISTKRLFKDKFILTLSISTMINSS